MISVVIISLILLVVLIAGLKLHVFLSFLLTSLFAGFMLGMPALKVVSSIKNGVGSIMGDLVIIICLGAMLGKIVAETGAAQKIADVAIDWFGKKYFHWAMMVTGFVVGIPLFYNVGFVLLIPLVFSVTYRTGLPAVYTALPMLAALSVTHGFLPPHPAPAAISIQLQANLGQVLLYGILVAIPTVLVAGILFAKTVRNIDTKPLAIFQTATKAHSNLPGSFNSFFSALLPALLLIVMTAIPLLITVSAQVRTVLAFAGDPMIILLASLLLATFTLGVVSGYSVSTIMDWYSIAVKDIAPIILIVAGAGALKQILTDSGVSNVIAAQVQHIPVHALALGWLLAAVIRVCVGSATVAGLTAAGIIAPIVVSTGVNANLMVLAIGAGSLMFSHVNDSGFWMFKEYFNLTLKETFRSWTLMETVVSVMGLICVLVLNTLIG